MLSSAGRSARLALEKSAPVCAGRRPLSPGVSSLELQYEEKKLEDAKNFIYFTILSHHVPLLPFPVLTGSTGLSG